MDIPVHNQILWRGCVDAARIMNKTSDDPKGPIVQYPSLVRGSWCNDMNQASEVFKYLGNDGIEQFPEIFFHELWDADREQLFEDVAKHHGSVVSQAMTKAFDPNATHLYDVGKYNAAEHLDADPKSDTAMVQQGHGATRNVEDGIYKSAAGRLHTVFHRPLASRFDSINLSFLGRALHTVQDYFSHTNQVELMLWHLASQNEDELKLPQTLIASFNAPMAFLDPTHRNHKRTVLRGFGSTDWKKEDRIFFAYRNTVEATPVTSGVFEMMDTVWSMLSVYERHLLGQTTGAYDRDRMMSLVFSLVEFPRKDLVRFLTKTTLNFKELIDKIGRAVRGVAYDVAIDQLVKRFPEREDALKDAGALLKSYDGKDASDWATAGRLGYLKNSIEEKLLDRYTGYDPTKPTIPLPNHTLINKDYQPHNANDMLRFDLACWMASRVTRDLLVAYFSGADYAAAVSVLERWLIHPTRYAKADLEPVAKTISNLHAGSWRLEPLPES
jgi:hypothetical protein